VEDNLFAVGDKTEIIMMRDKFHTINIRDDQAPRIFFNARPGANSTPKLYNILRMHKHYAACGV